MTELATQTLHTVAREITVALGDARQALETYVEQPGNPALLERCRVQLHQVQGVLRLLEIYGAALLAEEMEQVARYLIGLGEEHKNQAEALDALMRSMVQLPGYLERVLAGGRDLALVLLPLLNDLRAVRGSALLSEGTLLLLNLKSDRQAQPAAPAPGEVPLTASQWARRLRARFQTGLVGWIRGERTEQNLETLAAIALRLEQVATQQAVFQLWWVVGALLEALRENGVEAGVSVKRLLGLADRELKRLYEQGEGRYAQHPPIELLNNLLYYVARSSSTGPRIAAVRASFRLNELLPADESIEQERENLSAPSIKLMHTVAAAIREDLSRVKDVLDIFVRRGGGQAAELEPQIGLLKKLGDTLGVLGLGGLRARVQEGTGRLEAIVTGKQAADEAALVQVAAILIEVEDHLDDQLVGLILPRKRREGDGEPVDQDFQQVQGAVLRECVVNLARVKEYVAQNVSGTLDTAGFDSWPQLMRGIKAGLLMLGKSRAVDLIEEITRHLRRVMQPGGTTLAPEFLDRLADAIVSLEYYIETLQAGRSDPWYMLDNARSCLDALAHQPERVVPTVAPVSGAEYARTLRLLPAADSGPMDAVSGEPTGMESVAPPPVLDAAQGLPASSAADPDLIALFIEEASEEVAKIEQYLPVWDHNPLESDALLTVRRAFHTLKGSGRMVDARNISEFAWAIENLLNRLLDGTLVRSPAMLDTLRRAVAVLPQLVAELQGAAPVDVAALAARAHAQASGHELAGMAAASGSATAPAAATATAPPITAGADAAATSSQSAPATAAGRPAWDAVAATPGPAADTAADAAADGVAHTADADATILAAGAADVAGTGTGEPADAAADVVADAAPVAAADAAADAAPAPGTQPAATPPDAVLRDIYARETAAHVATVRGWLARERNHPAPHVLPEEVYRASHTLSGSSTMIEARHGMRLAEPVDHWLRKSFDSGVGLDDSDLALLGDCMTALQSVAVNLDESTGFFVIHDTLRARLARAQLQLDRRIHETAEAHARSGIGLQLPPQLAAQLREQMSQAQLAGSIEPGASAGREPAVAAAPPGPDYDPEIAAIFSEEAVELLEASESALTAWNAAPSDSAQVAALKRPLHTLKGGARMANVQAMGDLAHELESLVTQIETGLARGGEGARQVAQQSLDELARMREAIAAGRGVAPATELIAQIRAIARGAESPVAEAEAEAEAEAAQIEAALTEIAPPAAADTGLEPVTRGMALPAPAIDTDTAAAAAAAAAPLRVAAPLPPGREPAAERERSEMARVSAELLDQLLNHAGEVSIARARLEQQLGSIDFNLGELARTVTRLKEQLRKLEIETEAQILHRHESEPGHRHDFDPLELDRYSSIQQFSRALAESTSDVGSIQGLLQNLIGEAQNLLQQQARTVTELQNGLMHTRMVSLQRHVQRLARIVRHAAAETGKRAELTVTGAAGELDRQVLERMLPPFEHLLRNAVVHGIEAPTQRAAAGKDETGHIQLSLRREGAEVIVEVSDDGAGMQLGAIREKGLALGLIQPDHELSDEDVMQLVLEPGFSTASSLTQQAGRGIGMDVVATEIKKLGGALHMESTAGHGTRFTIRLPFTLAISHALVVRTGEEYYALPLPTVEGVVRMPREEVAAHLRADGATYSYGGQRYRLQPLANYVGMEAAPLPEQDVTIPVVLVRAGEHSTGLVADELIGSREIVVKPVGPQICGIRGISGATILGDGRIVIILDIGALVRAEWRGRSAPVVARERADERTFALVVDDSITVRRVTQRLLERNGMRVLTARDGMDAVALLQEQVPDIILLDIEMPRMDGYEVAAHVRNDARLRDIPIIMITSRVGEKHRARAIELGVDDYLGKPYQESQLIDAIAPLVAQRRAVRASMP